MTAPDRAISRRKLLVGAAGLAAMPGRGGAVTAEQFAALLGRKKTYLGPVATRTYLPQNLFSGNNQLNSRSAHFARTTIASLQIALTNWYLYAFGGAANGLENPVPAANTVYASVEYPAGAFTRLTWGGSASASIPSGGTLFSDLTPLNAVIPNGAQFWVRTFQSCAAGIVFSVGAGFSENASAGDALQVAASGLTDLTLGGGVPDSNGYQYGVQPAAILGPTDRPTVALIGDSRVYGEGDGNDPTLDRGELARSIGPHLAYLNLGCCGDRVAWAVGNYAQRLKLARTCSSAIVEYGANDIYVGGQTAAQVLANRMTLFGLLPASIAKFETTIAPETTSTDSWATVANQTAASGNAARVAANDAIRLGGRVSGFFEIADLVESSRDSGLWKAPGYTADGVHETNAAYLDIAASGAINPALIR